MDDDPFNIAWSLSNAAFTPGARYINSLLTQDHNIAQRDLHELQHQCQVSNKTKLVTYREQINPRLLCHKIYSEPSTLPEHHRIALSRLRLGSHNLAIETGRWQRIPRERRLCTCDEVETEQHALTSCPHRAWIRTKYPTIQYALPQMFEQSDTNSVAKFCHEVLKQSD